MCKQLKKMNQGPTILSMQENRLQKRYEKRDNKEKKRDKSNV